jgi:hypothetical protein
LSSALKNPGLKELLVAFWLILLISTLVTWDAAKPTNYGATNTILEASEIKVGWWNVPTSSDETLVIKYETELGPIDLYIVSQASYNATSGELPTSYFLHHYGSSTELQLKGPLPLLYLLVVSEAEQIVYSETWTYSSAAMIARALTYPNAVFLIVVTAVNLGWYWKTENTSKTKSPS